MLKINGAVGVLLAFIALAPAKAVAACSSYPYTFTNGTTADANQMMSNLNYVGGCAAPIASPSFTGNVGIGTATPTNILSLDGTSAQTFWMERGASTGNNLTVQAGGGLSGGTNENGGNLLLQSGISTGTGTSNILLKAYKSGGTSGTSDNSATTLIGVYGNGDVSIGGVDTGYQVGMRSNNGFYFGSSGTNNAAMIFNNSGAQQDNITFMDAGLPKWEIGKNTDNSFFFWDQANAKNFITATTAGFVILGEATNQLVMPASGNVGIGTGSPAARLHVAGGAVVDAPSTLTISTSTFTPSAVGSNTFRAVLVHASCPCTIANPSGTAVDGARFILEIWQSSTGGDTVSTWGSNYDFGTAGPPTLSTGASKGDFLGFSYSAQNSKYNYIGIQQGF